MTTQERKYHVYGLYSADHGKIYIGHTSDFRAGIPYHKDNTERSGPCDPACMGQPKNDMDIYPDYLVSASRVFWNNTRLSV